MSILPVKQMYGWINGRHLSGDGVVRPTVVHRIWDEQNTKSLIFLHSANVNEVLPRHSLVAICDMFMPPVSHSVQYLANGVGADTPIVFRECPLLWQTAVGVAGWNMSCNAVSKMGY